jgi:two-component system nitrate/nitrite response regulator NarL
MPILNGIQASLCLRESHPRTKILFLSIHEQSEYISAAFSAGASGYVTKRRLARDLALAIREVIQGHTFLSPSLRK